jgi:hypothetical protein
MAPSDSAQTEQFNVALGDVLDFLKDLDRETKKLFDGVNRWLPWLGPAAGKVRDALVWCGELIARIFKELWELVTSPGVPWTLFSHAGDWSDIGARVGGHQGDITFDGVKADEKWEGEAARTYREMLPRQKEAVVAYQAGCNDMHNVLRNVAIGIIAFWVALAIAVIVYLVELAAAAAATTPPATPAAPVIAGIASTKFIAILGGLVTALSALFGAAMTQTGTLNNRLDDGVFEKGQWPKTTTADFADGSVADGDPTDWRIKQPQPPK